MRRALTNALLSRRLTRSFSNLPSIRSTVAGNYRSSSFFLNRCDGAQSSICCSSKSSIRFRRVSMTNSTLTVAGRLFSTEPSKFKKRPRLECTADGCPITASFGYGGGKREYCAKHKKQGMFCLSVQYCKHELCRKLATFGMRGGKVMYCSAHKQEEMEDLRSKRCEVSGCEKFANYGFVSRTHCGLHRRDGMDNMVNRRCMEPHCRVLTPNFDIPGGTGRFCKKHMKEGMVDVRRMKRVAKADPKDGQD